MCLWRISVLVGAETTAKIMSGEDGYVVTDLQEQQTRNGMDWMVLWFFFWLAKQCQMRSVERMENLSLSI